MPLTELERSLIASVEKLRKQHEEQAAQWSKEREKTLNTIERLEGKVDALIKALGSIAKTKR